MGRGYTEGSHAHHSHTPAKRTTAKNIRSGRTPARGATPRGAAGNGHQGVQALAHMEHSATTSFAQMLQLRRHLTKVKLVDWVLVPKVSIRRDQDELNGVEQQRFLCAFNVINADGRLGQLVEYHGQPRQMHHTDRFLPWHRVYLREFEKLLQSVHPDVTLPYWDWTDPSEQTVPPWLVGFTPTVTTPSSTITVTRAPGSSGWISSVASQTPAALSNTTFSGFTDDLESIHDSIHVWVGGSMGVIPTAPADPLFWMHHANIDRLWWQWQDSSQGSGKNPPLSGSAAIMDPWAVTEPETRDAEAMGFTYS